jgi:hypothetical protein
MRDTVNTLCSLKGGNTVGITDAKKLIGRMCDILWLDRQGKEVQTQSRIYDVTYVPLYGGYVITDSDDIRLDKIIVVSLVEEDGSIRPFFSKENAQLPIAA